MSFAALYYLLFGTASELLGVLGWVRAKSKPSLIAGLASGMLLTIAGVLGVLGLLQASLWLGGVVSLLLLGRFLPAFLKTKSIYPAGLMSALSLVGVALAVSQLF